MELRGLNGSDGRVPDMEVLVVEAHPVFRAGIVSCLDVFDGIGRVEAVGTIEDAWAHPAVGESDAVLVDAGMEAAAEFVTQLLEFSDARVVALADGDEQDRLGALVDAGAVAALVRDDLTTDQLGSSLHTIAAGATTMPGSDRQPGIRAVAAESSQALTEREQRVLALVAEGRTTRCIGEELHFSDRTVKKVLGTVVDKLGARGRSHAIACAVRRGLI